MAIVNKPLSIPRNGLVGEWLLDGNAIDTNDGTKNNGTATNVSYAKTSVGYQSQAGVFNGSSSLVSIGGINASINDNDFSICFNAKFNSVSTGRIFYFQDRDSSVELSSGILRLVIYDGSINSVSSSVSTGTDYVFCFTRSKSEGMKMYMNGIQVSSSSYTGNAYFQAGGTTLGKHKSLNLEYLSGTLSGVRLYDRVLSTKEIQSLYLEGKRALSNYGAPDVMGKIGYVFESFGDDTLWETVAGTAVTRTAGTATTDNLGMARALTNPNYSWGSLTYTAAYSWENSGSGWNLAKNPSGVSATGINRTTTFRTLYLSSEALSADEEAQLAKLCEYSHPVRFTTSLPGSLKNGLVLDLNGNVSGTTAYDQSGNGNNGTLVNSPTQVRRFQSKGLSLNGTNQSVAIPQSVLNTSEFTLSMIVNVNSGGDDETLFHFRNTENTRGWVIFSWSKGDGGRTVNSPYFAFYADDLNTSTALTPGKTYLMTAVYKGGVQYIYVNNWLLASRSTSGNPLSPTSAKLFTRSDTSSQFFAGYAYDTFVWNRGLSPQEIQQLFYSTYLQ